MTFSNLDVTLRAIQSILNRVVLGPKHIDAPNFVKISYEYDMLPY